MDNRTNKIEGFTERVDAARKQNAKTNRNLPRHKKLSTKKKKLAKQLNKIVRAKTVGIIDGVKAKAADIIMLGHHQK